MSYVQGTTVRILGRFKDDQGQLQDPEDVELRIQPPTGALIVRLYSAPDASVVRTSRGIYYSDIDTSEESGSYKYNFAGLGDNVALLPVRVSRELRVTPMLS